MGGGNFDYATESLLEAKARRTPVIGITHCQLSAIYEGSLLIITTGSRSSIAQESVYRCQYRDWEPWQKTNQSRSRLQPELV
jgi:hypothetical protein